MWGLCVANNLLRDLGSLSAATLRSLWQPPSKWAPKDLHLLVFTPLPHCLPGLVCVALAPGKCGKGANTAEEVTSPMRLSYIKRLQLPPWIHTISCPVSLFLSLFTPPPLHLLLWEKQAVVLRAAPRRGPPGEALKLAIHSQRRAVPTNKHGSVFGSGFVHPSDP